LATPSRVSQRAESEDVAGECFRYLSTVGRDDRYGDDPIVRLGRDLRQDALLVTPTSMRGVGGLCGVALPLNAIMRSGSEMWLLIGANHP
jgi:hypothetical protein